MEGCANFLIWDRMQENKLPESDFNRKEEDYFLPCALCVFIVSTTFSIYCLCIAHMAEIFLAFLMNLLIFWIAVKIKQK